MMELLLFLFAVWNLSFEEHNMFYLSLIEHKLRLPPHLLSLPLQDAIKKELENIFLDKVDIFLSLSFVYTLLHIYFYYFDKLRCITSKKWKLYLS